MSTAWKEAVLRLFKEQHHVKCLKFVYNLSEQSQGLQKCCVWTSSLHGIELLCSVIILKQFVIPEEAI